MARYFFSFVTEWRRVAGQRKPLISAVRRFSTAEVIKYPLFYTHPSRFILPRGTRSVHLFNALGHLFQKFIFCLNLEQVCHANRKINFLSIWIIFQSFKHVVNDIIPHSRRNKVFNFFLFFLFFKFINKLFLSFHCSDIITKKKELDFNYPVVHFKNN